MAKDKKNTDTAPISGEIKEKKPDGAVAMTGSPADTVEIDPVIVTEIDASTIAGIGAVASVAIPVAGNALHKGLEKVQSYRKRKQNQKNINELFENAFEARSEFDAMGQAVARPQIGDLNAVVKKNVFDQTTLRYWINRARQERIQKQIIDNA